MPKSNRILLAVLTLGLVALPVLGVAAWNSGLECQNLVEQSDPSDASERAFAEARSLIDNENWHEAEARLRKFIELYQRQRNTPAALYYLALAFKKQNNLLEANRTIDRIVREFPRSSWANDARAMRVEIASLTGDRRVIEEELGKDDFETKVIALQGLFIGNPERALELVAGILKPDSKSPQKLREAAVGLLGQHRSSDSLAMLTSLARDEKAGKLRGQAIFWLGTWRDDSTLELLKDLARSNDPEASGPAIMALAQRRDQRATSFLLEMARTSPSIEARKQALFWLGQRADDQMLDALFQFYDSEKSEDAKQQIIMTLGIHRSKKSLAKLIEIAKSDSSKSLRSQAVFWIGQSRDPEAVKFLEEILK
jgi:hypothetical protein